MKSPLKKGLPAALASALFLGIAPVLGKQAIRLGIPPLGVVAVRTALAAFLLLLVLFLFRRSFLYIYPAGLLGCLLAGGINGLGSLFYYAALARIDASLGQLLYSLYPLFLMLALWLDRQPPSRLTLFRLSLIVPAIYLLTRSDYQRVDLLGILMMLVASALYALHLPINQRVLFDMPAPTVTFYTLLAMSLVVVPAFVLSGTIIPPAPVMAWGSVMGLALVTFLSRLTLFLGVKHLGGLQTALLGLGELLVTILVSHLWLGERLSLAQWGGTLLLLISLVLVAKEKPARHAAHGPGWLGWLRPPGLPRDIPWPYD